MTEKGTTGYQILWVS